MLTSNGAEHWTSLALAVFDDPIRRGVPEHCCIGVEAHNGQGKLETVFGRLADSGAWTQIVVRGGDWLWKPEPEADIEGPHPYARLPERLDRERDRLLPSAIMHQKRERQGYLFDRIFPITHSRLVQVFEVAIRAGWAEMADSQKRQSDGLEQLCESALRILCMQVFNHRDVLDQAPDTSIEGLRRPATTYQELIARVQHLPDHLKGLRTYLADRRTATIGLDAEAAIFDALSRNSEYDFACLTADMLGPFYQAALMRDPATGEVDKERRKKHGVFYTSRRITELILDRLPIEEIHPQKRFLLDPTCGSGSFLMAGERRLAELIKPRCLTDSEKLLHASHFIQGNDRDPFAVLVAKLQLVLDVPEAECRYRFRTTDIDFRPSGTSVGVPYEDRPSIIVGNPPFLRYENVHERAALFFHAAVAEWLSDGGLLGFVLPATFLSGAGRSPSIRQAILSSCELLELWDLPRNILSDEKDVNGGTNGGDIETCVVLLRKQKKLRNVVSFCRVFGVERSASARKLFRHRGKFTSHGLCVPATDWTPLPQQRWAATPLAAALRRLYTSSDCCVVRDVCELRNGIKRSPEKPVQAEAAPSAEHVPWLQTAVGTHAYTSTDPSSTAEYIRYPGEMFRPRLEWARRDCNTGERLTDDEWRNAGIFTGRKILIHKNVDPATRRPLRAFVDVGNYPSDNFHFAWLDPSLRGDIAWTYEALLAVLSGPVSQLCLTVARTRNNPTDLIKATPLPRVDRGSMDVITEQVERILRIDPADSDTREQCIKAMDHQVLSLYPLSEWEQDLLWHTVWDGVSDETPPNWTDKPWPIHGVVEAIREADENGPATIRIRIPEFSRRAQVYEGQIPADMPGWAMVEGIEFQAELPWSDAEESRFDPLRIRRFSRLPFAYEDLEQIGHLHSERA